MAETRAGEIAHESSFIQLCRVGFLGRGILYLLIGLLVLGTGRTEDLTGALEYIGEGWGRFLLMGITVGLAAYGLWRLADAAFGIEHPIKDNKNYRKRAIAAGIGTIYILMAYKAVRILLTERGGEDQTQQNAGTVLDLPGGNIVLAAIAIGLAIGGASQLNKAMKCSFLQNLDGRATGDAVKWLGRIGYAARGTIMILVGVLIGRAAIESQSSEAGGMEQALDMLSGPVLYAVAAGLMLFGLFSVIEGLFRRLHAPDKADIKRKIDQALPD
ncbi:DUF1206 domain-containing protein [Sphingomonas sabuli]|uniref:DUF1206 domain-containing protein n=1 Tax=Sphingomonas sabuli TaxID=2764186 RepID=A0A7G9L5D8_9SPHN|nr:DUF1206 domain-containing protein [Sphingomonas sabuli]QNM83837.1 DUF1206 domain-containing protein [Sphingomonas sabuli]